MEIQENVSLLKLNTFGIDVKAHFFTEIHTFSDIQELIPLLKKYSYFLLLGGGSNILFTKNFHGLVIRVCLKGIKIKKETSNHYFIEADAGENWSNFVDYCIENQFAGLENLVLIPGNIGSAPVQNIGAYGAEQQDAFYELNAVNLKTGENRNFAKKDCHFAYRNSIFKQELKGKYLITSVTYRLNKQFKPNIQYKALRDELQKKGIAKLNIKNVSDCVKEIRQSKLPDPEQVGNAGSFFKNPVINEEKFEIIQKRHPNLPFYKEKHHYKIPAAWLIDQCGWKGKRMKNAGVHSKQALVIVNYGNASGKEILKLSKAIQKSVSEKFNIELCTEVKIH